MRSAPQSDTESGASRGEQTPSGQRSTTDLSVGRRDLLRATGLAATLGLVGVGAAQSGDPTEIEDWNDMAAVGENLGGEYVLVADLDSETAGYDEHVDVSRSEFTEGFSPSTVESGERTELGQSGVAEITETNYEVNLVDPAAGVVEWQETAEFTDPDPVVSYTTTDPVQVGWDPLGELERVSGDGVEGTLFTGRLDGNDHEIAGLVSNRPERVTASLFAGIGAGTVENLALTAVDLESTVGEFESEAGAVAGESAGTVRNCSVEGRVTAEFSAGGLVGANSGTVENCTADTRVDGEFATGGLVGGNTGTVDSCTATGEVSGGFAAGGLVGSSEGTVVDSLATADVTADTSAGGLIGAAAGTVENSHYNVDAVEIDGGRVLTVGGLFDEQYQDWLDGDRSLSLAEYDSLPVVDGRVELGGEQAVRDALGFLDDPDRDWRLGADIDLTGGDVDLYLPYLAGSLDGDGHTVTLDVGSSGRTVVGFVGRSVGTVSSVTVTGVATGSAVVGGVVGTNAGTLANVTADVEVSGVDGGSGDELFLGLDVGGLVGTNEGTIEDCLATGAASGTTAVGGLVGTNNETVRGARAEGAVDGSEQVGGLVGNSGGAIANCTATGAVTGETQVGGLVGWHNDFDAVPTTTDSAATGAVTGDSNVGGLAGENSGTVERSVAEGTVTGETQVGGLVGSNDGTLGAAAARGDVNGAGATGGVVGASTTSFDGESLITGTYAVGEVTGGSPVGGAVGRVESVADDGPSVEATYWDVQSTGQSAGIGGGDGDVTGLESPEMRGETATDRMDGLDFDETWATVTDPDGYPVLQWETEEQGTVTGTVTDGETGLADLQVQLRADGSTVATATTDATGGYELSVPPGSYELVVDADGFEAFTESVTVEAGDSRAVDVVLTAEGGDDGAGDDGTDGGADDGTDDDGTDNGTNGSGGDGFGPGFGLLSGVAGIGGVAYLLSQRLGTDETG